MHREVSVPTIAEAKRAPPEHWRRWEQIPLRLVASGRQTAEANGLDLVVELVDGELAEELVNFTPESIKRANHSLNGSFKIILNILINFF